MSLVLQAYPTSIDLEARNRSPVRSKLPYLLGRKTLLEPTLEFLRIMGPPKNRPLNSRAFVIRTPTRNCQSYTNSHMHPRLNEARDLVARGVPRGTQLTVKAAWAGPNK